MGLGVVECAARGLGFARAPSSSGEEDRGVGESKVPNCDVVFSAAARKSREKYEDAVPVLLCGCFCTASADGGQEAVAMRSAGRKSKDAERWICFASASRSSLCCWCGLGWGVDRSMAEEAARCSVVRQWQAEG